MNISNNFEYVLFQGGQFKNGTLDDSKDYLKVFSEACGMIFSNTSDFYNCVQNQSYTAQNIILGMEKDISYNGFISVKLVLCKWEKSYEFLDFIRQTSMGNLGII